MEIKRFIFNPIEVNCYLLWDHTKEAVLIDCGALFPAEREQLKEFVILRQQGREDYRG